MYVRKIIALDNVQATPKEIVSRDQHITEIIVSKIDGVFALHFGDTADPVDVDDKVSFQPKDDEASSGLYFTNETAQAGKKVRIIIATGKRPSLNAELQRI